MRHAEGHIYWPTFTPPHWPTFTPPHWPGFAPPLTIPPHQKSPLQCACQVSGKALRPVTPRAVNDERLTTDAVAIYYICQQETCGRVDRLHPWRQPTERSQRAVRSDVGLDRILNGIDPPRSPQTPDPTMCIEPTGTCKWTSTERTTHSTRPRLNKFLVSVSSEAKAE